MSRSSTSRFLAALLLALVGLLVPRLAQAHRIGESYLFLKVYAERIEGWVEANTEDLDRVLSLDSNADGKIGDDELMAQSTKIRDYVKQHLSMRFGDSTLALAYGEVTPQAISVARFARVGFTIEDAGPVPEEIGIDYSVLFDEDPAHRAMVVVEFNERTQKTNLTEQVSLVFSADNRSQTLDLRQVSKWNSFVLFLKEGVHHIWIGWDHILFLLVLLLPAVLVLDSRTWSPIDRFKPALWSVVKIVTVFTVAHSVTLSLGVLGYSPVPSWLVESVIAISIIVAALNNIVPFLQGGIAIVIFAFGLFHGFGFAGLLQEMISDRSSVTVPLVGFNLGVEIGQLAIVVVAFPLLFAARRTGAYLPLILRAGSVVAMVVAAIWFAERAFDLSIISGE